MSGKKYQIIKGNALIPIFLTFFVMGFADLAGIATNYIREDYCLSDSTAGFLPGSLYIWFFILSVPAGVLMSRIGRRRTVIAGLAAMSLGMVIPMCAASFHAMLPAFAFIGAGTTLLGVGLNPFLASLVPDSSLASSMTAGQTVKALASIASPALAALGATGTICLFGLGWKSIFAIYLVITAAVAVWLALTPVEETGMQEAGSMRECLALLKSPAVLMAFLAVVCHVGSDVSLNVMLPEIFEKRLGIPLSSAAFAGSVYFTARLAGSVAGVFALRRISIRKCLTAELVLLAAGTILIAAGHSAAALCAATVLLGLGNANICTLIISSAFLAVPERRNDISGLTMMGLSGGALFSLMTGFLSSIAGITASLALILAATAFIFVYAVRHTR